MMNYEMKSASVSSTAYTVPSTNSDLKESTIKVKISPKKRATKKETGLEVPFINTNPQTTNDIKNIITEESEIQKQIEYIHSNITNDETKLLEHLGTYTEEPYHIIESYFEGQHLDRLVRHQIESYNHFVNYQILRTIQMFNPVTIHSENDYVAEKDKYFLEIFISFTNFKLYPPQIHENNGATKMMLPQEAKLRNFTYASTMTVDVNIQYVIRNTEDMDTPKIIEKVLPKINIGKLPIMLKSSVCTLTQNKFINHQYTGECSMDCGGYFIVKGSEKTVLGQERAAENRVYCFDGKNTTKWNWFAEIKSVPDFKCISPKQIEMMIASKNNGFGNGIFVNIPRIKQPIELFVLFRALGVLSDKNISQYILLDISDKKQVDLLQCLQASMIDANKYMTQEDALRHITASVAFTPINMDKDTGARKKREFTLEVLDNDLFPHCKTVPQKLYLLGYMAKKLLQTSLGWLPPDDRDSYLNKRIELTGTLLNNLFRNYFNKLVKEMQKQIVREINTGSWRSTEDYENIINMTNIYKIMKSTTIENGINRALSTGDFSIKQSNSSKVGVAQVLNRLTYVSSLSHLRRINTPLEKSGELIAPRKLHNTTWGFLCLTGDTEVLMSDRSTIKKIKDMKDGDRVTTVNPETLADEPSDIHSFFSKMPDKLFEITTISGRKIKATANHPFLVNNNGVHEWKNLEDLNVNDAMFVLDFKDNNYKTDLLESVVEIEPELVYDFTTRSDNHSFVASSFVTHNCPAETPEGQSIGVVKNISYMGHITIPTNSSSLYEYVKPYLLSVNDTHPNDMHGKVKVFVNGAWLGVTETPMELYRDMKDKKYRGIINIYISIVFDYKSLEIRICNDGGRLTRPVLKVRDNKALISADIIDKLVSKEISWNDLLTNCKLDESVIEYIDPEEQNYAMIAMKCKHGYLQDMTQKFNYTHCEIHPSTVFGVLASCIPYPEHNQAPRNTYQCLSPNELVWMADGSKKCIEDVSIGEKVLSFNPETLEITETTVVNQFVRKNEFPIYKLKTVSGREIIATEDHKLMTNKGWKTIGEMKENINEYKIGISVKNPVLKYDNNFKNEINDIILDEYTFSTKLESLEINKKTIEKYVNSLKTQNLLPLFKNEKKLEIISRIIGYLLSDGSINIYTRKNVKFTQCQFDFGREEDANEFKKDLSILGFKPCKITENIRTFNNTSHHTFHLCYNGSFPSFLIALDVSYGKKTETIRNPIPTWIMNDTANCRREFLKGFQGGDGCKIRWNKLNKKGYNFICGETSQQINPIYKESLIHFMSQCVDILKENDIIVNNSITEKNVEDNRVKIAFKISDAQHNLIKYYDTIGYAYCKTKNTQSFKIIEYLKSKNEFSKKHMENIEIIRNLHDNGLSNPEIANKLNIKTSYISDIIRSYKNGRKISTPNVKDLNIDNWMNTIIEEKNNCIFIPIESITPEPDGLVSDIEVESDNHSFIAGSSFLSSNCAMGKQAMGVYATNYDQRMDKTAYVLNYPSRPLVDTRLMNFIHLNRIPSGTQIHVAIMSHTGYNQEDSVLINKGSIDRGLFLATIYHTEKDEDKNIIRDEIIRCKPDPTKTKGIKFGNYDKLNPHGFIPENELVENRDVIIAKTIPIKENRNDPTKTIKYEDQSKTFRTTEETYIDKNYTGRNGDGYNFAKVRVRVLRKPVFGDKFCSLPTQQILTDHGWMDIQYVDITKHKVCSIGTDGNMCYEYPTAKFEYDHNDKMYSIKNKQIEIVCTLNHKLYVQKRYGKNYELIKAEDVMGKMVRFQKSLENAYPDIPTIRIGDVNYDMDAWLQFVGMFISDGHCDKNCKGIYISALKDRKVDFNKQILDNLEIGYSYQEQGKFFISGVKYLNIFEEINKSNQGALNKKLPDYVWNLSKRQSIVLLEALLQGDGSTMKYKDEDEFSRYGTISIQLANDISRLAVHCGWSGIIKIAEEPTGIARIGKRNLGSRAGTEVCVTQKHTYYKVSIIRKQNQPWINKKKNESNKEELIDYNGKVYCIEMPSSHTYYMRESQHSPSLIIGNSSRHGQKGTVGNIIPECDMPFTKEGLRPDIIINPHAIPSRMTIGQLKETLLGKVLLELGLFGDGTSFGNLDIKTITAELQKLGYESYGNELLYNGLTGEQLETNIFIGPVFYQRLKHMVNDKQHSRSIGPMVNLTRQPAEGRSRDGGFRIGEMERDVMLAHGMSRFCRERLYDVSDKYSVHVCKKCGMVAPFNDGNKNRMYANADFTIHLCKTCNNKTEFAKVEIPYAYKLMSQELQTINVVPRIITE